MTWFCIKHLPSGNIIPCAMGRMDRGGSWVEPCPASESPPRIFTVKRHAKGWLTTWLKGAVEQSMYRDWETGVIDDVTLNIIPKPHRKREEYKIVPISFRIGK